MAGIFDWVKLGLDNSKKIIAIYLFIIGAAGYGTYYYYVAPPEKQPSIEKEAENAEPLKKNEPVKKPQQMKQISAAQIKAMIDKAIKKHISEFH